VHTNSHFSEGALMMKRALLSQAFLCLVLAGILMIGGAKPSAAYLRGVNMSGLEFNPAAIPGVLNGDFTANSEPDYTYFGNKGLTLIRVPFLWERVQPTLNGALATAYIGYIDNHIAWAKLHGCKVILDLHNYGRYNGNVINGGTGVTRANFNDVWVKLSTRYKTETGVYAYGLMNEPHDMGTSDWKGTSDSCVDAIRANGDTKLIMVAGEDWSSAERWATSNGSTSWISDTANNFKYEAHCYFDHDASGTYGWTYDQELANNANVATIGQTRLAPFISWCQSNGVGGYLGEFGSPGNDSRWNAALNNFYNSLDSAGFDGTYWSAGEWWGTYPLSVQPANNYTTDAPQLPTLLAHLGQAPSAPTTPTNLTASAGDAQVILNWTASGGATTYTVKRSTVSGSGYANVATPSANAYTNTGLANGTAYFYVVSATNSAGTSANSAQASATPQAGIPAIPGGLVALPGAAQVNLSWNSVSGATAYDVKRSTVSGSGYAVVSSPAATSYSNTGLTNGTTYYYVVAAKSAAGSSGNSAQASATPLAAGAQIASGTATIDGTVDASWSSAGANGITHASGTISSSADLSATWKGLWDGGSLYILVDVTDDVKNNDSANSYDDDSVEVYLDADKNGGASYDANDRQIVYGYNDAALAEGAGRSITGATFAKADPSGTSYRVEIKIPWSIAAYTPTAGNVIGIDVHINDDDDGTARDGKLMWNDTTDGAWGNPGLFGTAQLMAGAAGPPATPTGLTATAGNTQVALSWTATSGATAYDVKRSTVSGSGYAVINSPTTNSYTNTGLTNGTTYYYVVAAKNASGSSANSAQVSATPNLSIPSVPTGLAATAGNAQVALAWNASSGATAYDVKRSTVSGSGYAVVSSPATTSYTNTGLTNGTTYYFVVSAKNAAGSSANSAQVSATPSAPVGGNTHAGTWAGQGVLPAAPSYNNLSQVTNVAANSTYVASVWIKGTGSVLLYVKAGSWGADIAGAQVRCNATSTWTQVSTPAFSTGANTQLTVIIQDQYSDDPAGTVYIDDTFLGVSGGANTLVNPGFESGAVTWGWGGVFSIVQPGGGAPPSAPTGLSGTAGNAQVALTWSASTGATSYNVKRSTVNGSGYATVSSPAGTSYTNTGLTNGTTYYYVVTAVSANGESGNSAQVSATPSAPGNTHAGIWAAKGTFTTAATWSNMFQVVNVASNTSYVASIWVKGSGSANLYLKAGNWGADIAGQNIQCTATGTWTKFTTPAFNTGANTQITFVLQDSYGIAGTCYMDDVFLGVNGGTNVLANPGFESGNVNWGVGTAFSIVQNP
jgi:fibronectin type 3 domain-containing protein